MKQFTEQQKLTMGGNIAEILSCFSDNRPMTIGSGEGNEVIVRMSGSVFNDFAGTLSTAGVMFQNNLVENFNHGLLFRSPQLPRPNYSLNLASNFTVALEDAKIVVKYAPLPYQTSDQINRNLRKALEASRKVVERSI